MPRKSLEPLKKVTIDLYTADVQWLKENKDNFSDIVRTLVQNYVICEKAAKQRMTLGDLHAR